MSNHDDGLGRAMSVSFARENGENALRIALENQRRILVLESFIAKKYPGEFLEAQLKASVELGKVEK